MQTTLSKPAAYSGSPIAATLLGAATAGLLIAALTNTAIPLLGSERAIFLALVVLGMTMCSLGGMGRAPAKYGWTHPVTLFGIAVGTVMLLLTGGVVDGQIADRVAINIFAGLFAIKWLVGLTFVR